MCINKKRKNKIKLTKQSQLEWFREKIRIKIRQEIKKSQLEEEQVLTLIDHWIKQTSLPDKLKREEFVNVVKTELFTKSLINYSSS